MNPCIADKRHILIPREDTYVLDRRIISFHSCDRDISKWPYSNHFEIMLPEVLKNVQSLRLETINIPNTQYVFSNSNQNTKLSFSLKKYSSTNTEFETICINEGTYTPEELAIEIESKMGNGFSCKYNKVSGTFWFGNNKSSFTLRFDVKHDYGASCRNEPNIFNQSCKWGLPAYLGYKKTIYQSTQVDTNDYGIIKSPSGVRFSYDSTNWLNTNSYYVNVINPSTVDDLNDLDGMIGRWGTSYNNYCYKNEPKTKIENIDVWKQNAKIDIIDIRGEEIIYMEVEKYNTIDEIAPYSCKTNNLVNNDYHGKVNSAFAKIPIRTKRFTSENDSSTQFIMNVSQYEPPIEKISKLKFKFRYHDGRLVDFKSMSLSFSIGFSILSNEQYNNKMVRVPY